MEILTGEQMRSVDRRAIDELGIPSLELMEAAGRGVAERLLEELPELQDAPVAVLCGKGNNGGDGLVVARHLRAAGVAAEAYLLSAADGLSPDAAANLDAAHAAGVPVHEVRDADDWERMHAAVIAAGLVVDAILGTGVRGGARGLAGRVIEDLNAASARVASIDLPSGLNADSAVVEGPAVRAERTFTLCRPKLALVGRPAADCAGCWTVVDIGIPDAAVAPEPTTLEWLDAGLARELLPARPQAAHKGNMGHLLALAGSRGKSGAAVLLARGALRAGAGLVTVAAPAAVQPLIAVQQAEVMVDPLPETPNGGLSLDGLGAVRELLGSRDALALGPGLGTEPDTRRFVLEILEAAQGPVAIDADGLNALAEEGAFAPDPAARKTRPWVLTPHPGEAARLLSTTAATIQDDRIGAARRLAEIGSAVVVLKGQRTLVAEPGGRVAVNAAGNPGMATGGSGDVLTGIVGAFLARGLSPWDAARLAVFLHGDAGDRAAVVFGQESLIAGDIVDHLPHAFEALGGGGGR
jgi:NAD(P)H-hydrate epimerase